MVVIAEKEETMCIFSEKRAEIGKVALNIRATTAARRVSRKLRFPVN